MNILGTWTGVITYGKGYREHKGKEVFFDMDIIQDTDQITGTATDTRGFGINPSPAAVKGTIKGKKISFIKQYPHLHVADETIDVDTSQMGIEYNYEARYDESSKIFTGSWHGRLKVYIFGIFPFTMKGSGSWTMRRKSVQDHI